MKRVLMIPSLAVAALLAAPLAHANADLAAKHCAKCHDMEKKKKGPTYKAMSAKFKGKEAEAMSAITDPKNDHPEVKTKGDELATIVKWMLQQ